MQKLFGSPWKLLGTMAIISVIPCVGIAVYQNWKPPVTQAVQTTPWDDPTKRTPRAPQVLGSGFIMLWEDYYYHDWDDDGTVDGVSKPGFRVTIVPPGKNVPVDYYLDKKVRRIYYGENYLAPEGSVVFRHIASTSPEAKGYQDEFAKALLWQKQQVVPPKRLGPHPKEPTNIWE